MKQIIGITKVKDPYKFLRLLKKDCPNTSNNRCNELIHHINNNNFVWYIRCEKNEIRSISEYCDLFIKSSKYMKQNQFEFKPFDKVLVRDYDDDPWRAMHYSHFNNEQQRHYCANSYWMQCVPYNENTAHLLGTNKPYEEPKPKVWRVINSPASFDETYTDEELSNFIKTAVINNKDITNFHVMYIPNN